jgi:hypothetical protein
MSTRRSARIMNTIHTAVAAVIVAGAIIVSSLPSAATAGNASETKGPFQFEPLLTSAPCTTGGNASQPFLLPEGFVQTSLPVSRIFRTCLTCTR